VVPVVIDGAHRALPTGRMLPRLLARVSVSYLEPLRALEGESVQALNARVRAAVAGHLGLEG
jgi:1-acyl-sn-glycerol-3-phosphate acyltransferase